MRSQILCSYCATENDPGNSVCSNCQRRIVALPQWAQASRGAQPANKKHWAIRLTVGLILAMLVWFNYPYVPNPVI